MATEKYVPYKGVFGSSSVIEATLDWFENSSELNFLWVFPNGDTEMMSMNAASRAGNVVVNGNVVKISALTNYGESSECVFVYRSAMLKTKATQVYEGVIPLSAILAELEEIRRSAEDAKTEASKSLRIPEWDGETHFTDKDSRAGKVMGFDKDGKPTTGEDCKQVKDLFEAGKAAQESASSAAAQAQEAKRQADIAGTHASDCNDSVAECSELLDEAELEANKAKTYYEKTASVGADAVNKATVAANRAVEAKDAAVAAKDAVLAAKEDVASKTQELDKAVCYVACAASEVEGRVETAKQELTEKAELTKQEIAGFTDVYTKAETYSKSQIDGVGTGAEVTLKMNEIIAQLKDYEAVTGETLPNEFWAEVMAEFQRWQMNPNEVKEWVTTSATESTNPYFSTPPTKPVVDFGVVAIKGSESDNAPSFNRHASGIIFAPTCSDFTMAFFGGRGQITLITTIRANLYYAFRTFYGEYSVYAPNSTSVISVGINSKKSPKSFYAPKAIAWTYAFQGAAIDMFVDMRSASTAKSAFLNSKMSAENISKTLDSLPTWTGGASHVITFTGSPGAAELTQDSPSVAAAIAKGWTVEL